jgi:hypothetical protein
MASSVTFGEWLREQRVERKLTREELASEWDAPSPTSARSKRASDAPPLKSRN